MSDTIYSALIRRMGPNGVAEAITSAALLADGRIKFYDRDRIERTLTPTGDLALLLRSVFPAIHGIDWTQ